MKALDQMQEAVGELDMDAMEAVLGQLEEYRFENHERELLDQITEAAADFDAETCEALIMEWKKGKQIG